MIGCIQISGLRVRMFSVNLSSLSISRQSTICDASGVINLMNDNANRSLREQIEAFQAQLASRVSPEVQERSKARRSQLVASGIADQSLKAGEAAPDFSL